MDTPVKQIKCSELFGLFAVNSLANATKELSKREIRALGCNLGLEMYALTCLEHTSDLVFRCCRSRSSNSLLYLGRGGDEVCFGNVDQLFNIGWDGFK